MKTFPTGYKASPADNPRGTRAAMLPKESAPPILSRTPLIPAASGGIFTGRNNSQGEQVHVKRSFHRSFRYAVRGLMTALRREPNLSRQLLLGILVLVLAAVLQVSLLRLAILVVVVAAVLVLELLNSALEALCDAVHPHYHDKIRDAKDMSAGAVLIMSAAAVLVGLAVLGPPLWLALVR